MTQHVSGRLPKIFVCYRRDDAAGHAGRLCDRLGSYFGEEHIFMDIDHIYPGDDFPQIIEDAVSACDVFIAVIGVRWLMSGDRTTRRLDNPLDYVRLEISSALKRHV